MVRRHGWVALGLLLACNADPEPASTPAGVTGRDAPSLLTRVSLDLRGVRPTVAEIEAVEADPDALDGLVEGFLTDDRFEARVRDLYAELYLTRADTFPISADEAGVDDAVAFRASVGDEALRLLGKVAADDLPWTEIALADWTMADETLAAFLPLDYPAGGSGWQQATYTDGRPAAGVLSTTTLWWRYGSTASNANRGRANAASRLLLCNNYLGRPIEFSRDLDLLDEDAIADAIANDPACMNCHVTLDPLASYFWGFYWVQPTSSADALEYHPERERLWRTTTGVAPGFYGETGTSLADLAWQIAADPRFPTCAVEQVMEGLLRRPLTVDDEDAKNVHREAFLDGGLTMRALWRSVVTDPAYTAAAGDDEVLPRAAPTKLVSAEQLATQVEDLTGFSWTQGEVPVLGSDAVGVRTLAGGVDGVAVTAPATAPNATLVLVAERLAEAAAAHAVATESEQDQDQRRLFTAVALDEVPDEDTAAAQVQALHLAIFGRRVAADGDEVYANLALWSELYAAEADPAAAWAGVLTALLRDPDFLLY